jgi:hypothetical protein
MAIITVHEKPEAHLKPGDMTSRYAWATGGWEYLEVREDLETCEVVALKPKQSLCVTNLLSLDTAHTPRYIPPLTRYSFYAATDVIVYKTYTIPARTTTQASIAMIHSIITEGSDTSQFSQSLVHIFLYQMEHIVEGASKFE